ncbi:glycosyltransferase family 4 protein [Microbacterium deminutum]|uniref:D-inositol 3-phosphate glycosyltransferase n=1 Tax=Microbacterium deminutum TaxID=344164 RepID=A0ABN2Q597_9MICO
MAEQRTHVYHVGRSGDIPGGMTQVINAYLAWPFPRVDVDVIESRGDPGDHVAAARGFLRALRRIRVIARSGERATIVVHLSERGSFLREGWIARYAARLGLPVVAHLHGSEFAAFERQNPDIVRKVLTASSRVISLSDETSAICARHVGEQNVELVPNAIPSGRPREKEKLVVFGGVVSYRKGIDVLQEAWREAEPAEPWRLVVAGPIRDRHLVDDGLPGAEFVGSLDHSALMELLDKAEVAVLPSRDEAMPMFILEAMARRACVISTAVGGIPAVLSDGCGILVAPASVDDLLVALKRAMSAEDERRRIADAGFARFASRFSATAVYPRVESIWIDAQRGPIPSAALHASPVS